MHIVCIRLVHGNAVLVNNIRLVYVEDFHVVGQSFAADVEISTAKWTASRDLEELDVVAYLGKVDLLVEHECLLE